MLNESSRVFYDRKIVRGPIRVVFVLLQFLENVPRARNRIALAHKLVVPCICTFTATGSLLELRFPVQGQACTLDTTRWEAAVAAQQLAADLEKLFRQKFVLTPISLHPSIITFA